MINIGKIVKFAIKLGIGSVVAKNLLETGFEFGKAFKMAQLSEIGKIEPTYVTDILKYHNRIYSNYTTKDSHFKLAKEFISNDSPIEEDRTLFNTFWSRSIGFVARYGMYIVLQDPEIKLNAIIHPHQEYLRYIAQNNLVSDQIPFMNLELRRPSEFGYDFEFDSSILYQIAFENNVIYCGGDSLIFHGPAPLIQRLGNNFWTDYNLIAMDRNLPCISLDHYTADQFKLLD